MIKAGIYQHFKGGKYEVLGVANHTETKEEFVVYKALNGDGQLWARPLKMFLENVEKEGYKGPRFKRING